MANYYPPNPNDPNNAYPPLNQAYPPQNNPYPPTNQPYPPMNDGGYPPQNPPYPMDGGFPQQPPVGFQQPGGYPSSDNNAYNAGGYPPNPYPQAPYPQPGGYPPPGPNVQYAPVDTDEDPRKIKPDYEPGFSGPVKDRQCTDTIFLGIFIVFMVVWAGVSFYAYSAGSIRRVIAPIDSLGQYCGIDKAVQNEPYLVFFDLNKCQTIKIGVNKTATKCFTPQVCVEKCPTVVFDLERELTNLRNIQELRKQMLCVPGFDKMLIVDTQSARAAVTANKCAKNLQPSDSIARRCFPKSTTEIDDGGRSFGTTVLSDLENSWVGIVLGLIVAMLVCLLLVFVMKWIAAYVMWSSLVMIIVVLAAGIIFSISQYLKNTQKNSGMLWGGLGLGCGLLVIIFIITCYRNSIKLAIKLVKEGSKAVVCVTESIVFPLLPYLMYLVVVIAFVAVGIFLSSIGTPKFEAIGINRTSCVCTGSASSYSNGKTCVPQIFLDNCHKPVANTPCQLAGCFYSGLQQSGGIFVMHAYNFAAFLWGINIITAFGQIVLAMAFATWYWTFDKTKVPSTPVFSGIATTFKFHIGTISFGSMIITICQIVRFIIDACNKAMRDDSESNIVLKIFCMALKCLADCLQDIIEFINKNAYIHVAMHGQNFCTSAKSVFNLILRNIMDTMVIKNVAGILFTMLQLLVSCIMGGITYGIYYKIDSVEYNIIPALLVFFGTYVITTIFFDVYMMAIDTLFICFLEDMERNDGTELKPYFMSQSLMKILKGREDM